MGTPPTGALNARGSEKVTISDQYITIARNIYRDCPRGAPGEAKMCKNVLKW